MARKKAPRAPLEPTHAKRSQLADIVVLAITGEIRERDFHAAHAAGSPTLTILPRAWSRADAIRDDAEACAYRGVLTISDTSTFVRGTFPPQWREPPQPRGRPPMDEAERVARDIAKLLTALHCEAQIESSFGPNMAVLGPKPDDAFFSRRNQQPIQRRAREAAARLLGLVQTPGQLKSIERKFRMDMAAVRKLEEMARFDRFFCVTERFAALADRDARIDIDGDQIRLHGRFWSVSIGHDLASFDDLDCVLDLKRK